MISCEPKKNTETLNQEDRPRLVTNLTASRTRVSSPKPSPSRRASSQTRSQSSLSAEVNLQEIAEVNVQGQTPVNTQVKAPLKSALRSRSRSIDATRGEPSDERRHSSGSSFSESKHVRFTLPDDHVESHERPVKIGRSRSTSPRSVNFEDSNAAERPSKLKSFHGSPPPVHSASRKGSSVSGHGSTIETIPEEETFELGESSRSKSTENGADRSRREKKPKFNPRSTSLDLSQIE